MRFNLSALTGVAGTVVVLTGSRAVVAVDGRVVFDDDTAVRERPPPVPHEFYESFLDEIQHRYDESARLSERVRIETIREVDWFEPDSHREFLATKTPAPSTVWQPRRRRHVNDGRSAWIARRRRA